MKRFAVIMGILIMATGCAGSATRSFKVYTDPPDATVTVVSGTDLKTVKYRPPAQIAVNVPKDPVLAAKAVLEVSRDSYLTRTIALRDIADGQTLNIKLEKSLQVRYRLECRLLAPAPSETLQFRDRNISASFSITDRSFQMRLENLTPGPIKIIWAQAQYVDVREQPQAVMHSGIRFQERNNPIPDQVIQPKAIVQESVFPIRNVFVTGGKPPYDIKQLLPLDSEAAEDLKGKTLALFLPLEINRAIIPYHFRMQIVNVVKEERAR
ncbi:MAG TPA: hypothetical protein VK654_06160 [Nitrospirota bacterium]|nr:hypothetical protein [Nitrospirota bacterium]